MTDIVKIEDSPLWKAALEITNAAYPKIDQYPEEEKWQTVPRLRQHASSLPDEIAMAEGSVDPRDVQHYLGHARKELFALKSIYKVSHDNHLAEVDPDQMVKIDALASKINARLQTIPKETQAYLKSLDLTEKKK